jgi:hypothetical protein
VANRDRQSILKRSQIKSIQYRSALWNDHWTVANRDHQVTLKRSQIKSSIHPAGSFNPPHPGAGDAARYPQPLTQQ